MRVDFLEHETEDKSLDSFLVSNMPASEPSPKPVFTFEETTFVVQKTPRRRITFFSYFITAWNRLQNSWKNLKHIIRETNAMVLAERARIKEEKMRHGSTFETSEPVFSETLVIESPIQESVPEPEPVMEEVAAIVEPVSEAPVEETPALLFYRDHNNHLVLGDSPEAYDHVTILITDHRKAVKKANKKLAKDLSYILAGLQLLKQEKRISLETLKAHLKEKHAVSPRPTTLQKVLATIEDVLTVKE